MRHRHHHSAAAPGLAAPVRPEDWRSAGIHPLDAAAVPTDGRLSRSRKGMELVAEQRRIVHLLAADASPAFAILTAQKNAPGNVPGGIDKGIQSSDLKCAIEAANREAFRLVRRGLRELGIHPRWIGDGTYRVTTPTASYVLSDPVEGARLVVTLANLKPSACAGSAQ